MGDLSYDPVSHDAQGNKKALPTAGEMRLLAERLEETTKAVSRNADLMRLALALLAAAELSAPLVAGSIGGPGAAQIATIAIGLAEGIRHAAAESAPHEPTL